MTVAKYIKSLNILFIIGRYNYNGAYLIKICFCNNFAVALGKL